MDETNDNKKTACIPCIDSNIFYFFFLAHTSVLLFCPPSLSLRSPSAPYPHPIFQPFPPFFTHRLLALFSALAQPLLCSSLYQPPQRRPSAVWSPCAATNKGKVAVPAWPASWTKWPDIAKPAPAIATHPAAATGGQDFKEPWLWISMKRHRLVVSWIRPALMARDVALAFIVRISGNLNKRV